MRLRSAIKKPHSSDLSHAKHTTCWHAQRWAVLVDGSLRVLLEVELPRLRTVTFCMDVEVGNDAALLAGLKARRVRSIHYVPPPYPHTPPRPR